MKPVTSFRPLSILAATLALCWSAAGATARADDLASYGYVRVLAGPASVTPSGGATTAAVANQPILVGDRLSVAPGSEAELLLSDRNVLRAAGGSELVFEQLAFSADGADRSTLLKLLAGEVQLVVTEEALGDELPRVDTANATLYVQSPGSYRVLAGGAGLSEIVVREGFAEVLTRRGSAVVRAGERLVVGGADQPELALTAAGTEDPLELWGRGLAAAPRAEARYVGDALAYAAAPMQDRGSWIDVSGRYAWRPYVAPGWRPYSAGWWASTPSGFVWVADEPWGWVTTHYGAWDFVPSYGWVWFPGRVFAPSWVVWYWGPSYVGWIPTGYYSHFYGPRARFGLDFRVGLFGWAGGSWDPFFDWTFCSLGHFRTGHRLGALHRGADLVRENPRIAIPRGLITTDTRAVVRSSWKDPAAVRHALLRGSGSRGTVREADLPDVTPFVARRRDLPPTVERSVFRAAPAGDSSVAGRAGSVARALPAAPASPARSFAPGSPNGGGAAAGRGGVRGASAAGPDLRDDRHGWRSGATARRPSSGASATVPSRSLATSPALRSEIGADGRRSAAPSSSPSVGGSAVDRGLGVARRIGQPAPQGRVDGSAGWRAGRSAAGRSMRTVSPPPPQLDSGATPRAARPATVPLRSLTTASAPSGPPASGSRQGWRIGRELPAARPAPGNAPPAPLASRETPIVRRVIDRMRATFGSSSTVPPRITTAPPTVRALPRATARPPVVAPTSRGPVGRTPALRPAPASPPSRGAVGRTPAGARSPAAVRSPKQGGGRPTGRPHGGG